MTARGTGRRRSTPVLGKIVFPAAVILALFCLGPDNRSHADQPLTQILDGILGRYGAMPGLMVDYEREIVTKSMALLGDSVRKDTAKGRIYFKPPHHLRVEQETPSTELVVTDGRTLWWYIPDKNRAYKYPARRLGEEMGLLSSIFRGLKDVRESFQVSVHLGTGEGFYRLKLIPRPPWPQVEHIELTVAGDEYLIRTIEIHNYMGGITRFILDRPASRETFEKGFFQFDAPPGIRVVEEGDQ
ncbi:MAG: outer membrane lipoprotein carrier protein LolA [Deltaproteobacteria bacterium]|nr:outer membrane lipoprotein carrier protein LolA [Deltaproteobacteria bacterium]MBW2136935.1 outer membrane lipoprotein carrier protein LolA [Deltaproteobacteria bacterium]